MNESTGRVVVVKTKEEYDAAVKSAAGPVALEFIAQGCDYCEEEKPEVDKLAATCSTPVTIIRADIDDFQELADEYQCEGTPTIYFAKKAEDLVPGKAKELDDAAALKRRLKCARTPKP